MDKQARTDDTALAKGREMIGRRKDKDDREQNILATRWSS